MRRLALAIVLLAHCKRPAPLETADASTAFATGDGRLGHDLVVRYECNRCHTLAALDPPSREKQCTECHSDILRSPSSVNGTPEQLARWQSHVAEIADVPSLESIGSRLRRDWIKSFLLHPHDVRPNLQPTMPRLRLDESQALDIATYLSPLDAPDEKDPLENANAARGRALATANGCATCHRFTGVAFAGGTLLPTSVSVPDMPRAARLAPDFRFTRDRFRMSAIVLWIHTPTKIKPDTIMPTFPVSREDARDIAAFIVKTPLDPVAKSPLPKRLPILARAVRYDEVSERVFRKTCWHCHGEADFELGDGGPGNSGGFGFKGKGINLSSYTSTFAGFLDDRGERTSLFEKNTDGTPYIVAALLARQKEEVGDESDLRGMPLGLPSVTPEDLQLVETWIAQGRQR